MANKNNQKTRKELGDKLRKAREEAELTQAEVAEAADVNVNYYARIERGEVTPSLERLKIMMKVLKIRTLNISS
ncbi:MAG: helix-turn-helix transcriptional regulator [bacterium]